MAPQIVELISDDWDVMYVKHVIGNAGGRRGRRPPCGSWKKYLERFTGFFPPICQMEDCGNEATLGVLSNNQTIFFLASKCNKTSRNAKNCFDIPL